MRNLAIKPGGSLCPPAGGRCARAALGPWIAVLSLALARPAIAQLSTLETPDLRLVYVDPTETYLAPHAARCFLSALASYEATFRYRPSERTTVLMTDLMDSGNGSATAAPRNRMSLNIAPLNFAYETMPPGERLITMMNHELQHIWSMDQAAPSDAFFRKMFQGKVVPTDDHPETILYLYLTTPRTAVPRWYQEGSAVFFETWLAGGLGRAQGAWDEMVFRSMARDGSRFYDPLGLVSEGIKIDFQVGVNSYLYGTRFVSYLALQHSPESVIDWVSRGEGSRAYFAHQFEAVYGRPLDEVWQEWIAWERGFQAANLQAIRQQPLTPYRDLSTRALGSVSRAHFDADANRLYAALNYPGVVAHVGAIAIDDGSVEHLVDVKGPMMYTVASLAFDPARRILFYTTDNQGRRDVVELDPDTQRTRVLLKDARIGDLAFDAADRSLWGLRQLNGIVTLVRIPHPYEQWEQVHTWPYGDVPYDLDVSPDGKLLSTSFADPGGRHTLRIMQVKSLLEGDATPMAEVEFGSTIPSGFVFAPDGQHLYGSSFYTGVSNIYRYDVQRQSLEAMSNCETGFFRPVPLEDGGLIIFRYTGEGFVPARIDPKPLEDLSAITFLGQQVAEKHPVVRDWQAGSPAAVPLDSLITGREKYRAGSEIGLESIYPVVEGYRDFPAYGISAVLSDPLYQNRFSITASYTPNEGLASEERLHFEFDYSRHDFRARATYNDADFYDLFGPTKTSRKGYTLGGGWKRYLIYDEPRELLLDVDATFHGDIDELPRFQDVEATVDRLFSTVVTLNYSHRLASLGAVDYEKGLQWEVIAGADLVEGDTIPGVLGRIDYGFALPLAHSSIWLRPSAGILFGDIDDPFSNVYFGGFGNNWVDHGSIKRYQNYAAFPGIDLSAVPGRNFGKLMLEWNLPPLRFRRVGTPGFFVTWMRTSLFSTALKTNLDEPDRSRELANAGVQLDFRIGMLSAMDLTLSLGYAVAFEHDVERESEAMFSLKIFR